MLANRLRALARERGFVDLAYVDNQAGTTGSITIPAKARQGDFLLFIVRNQGNTSATYSGSGVSASTTIHNGGTAVFNGYISSWDGTASYSFTASGAATTVTVAVLVFRDVTFDVASALAANSSTPVAASITASVSSSFLVFWAAPTNASVTFSNLPAGFTTLLQDSDANPGSTYIGLKTGVSAGATGTTTITSSNANTRALQLVLKPI